VLGTFVTSPEPYLQGTQQLISTVAETAVKPLAELPGSVATEVAAHTNWTPVVILFLVGAAGAGWYFTRRSRLSSVLLGLAVKQALGRGRPSGRKQNGGHDGQSRN
jgi:hypothetical protein